jgi:predicted nucleic acid-binding protein
VPVFYLDSSAIVKLVRQEPESSTLMRYVESADLVASELALTEVPRAVRRAISADPALPGPALLAQAAAVLDAIALRSVDRASLVAAGAIDEPALRSLDAIHLVAAIELGPLDAFVTYDERQAAVARLAGLRTVAPGQSPVG